ncbi:MAG: glycosyltransferase, partial [Anaerolineales bacterium]
THHSDVVRQRGWLRLYGPMLRRVLRATDRIIATSPNYIETSPWLSPIREKCCVVPLGVDHARFTPAPVPFDGPPTLVFVGRLRYYKGIGTLLQALAMLPEVLLEIVGDGPMRNRWKRQVGELNLGSRVRFLGQVEDAALPELYRRAHVFVLPADARAEAFGQVLLEAMASGLACVTTDVGTGTSWVVEDGVTGLVVPPSDAERLTEALRQLMNDSERRLAMGRAGRVRVEERFTLARMVQGVQDAYEKALAA